MKNKETHYLGQFSYNNENQGDHDIILMKIKVTLTKQLYASILLKSFLDWLYQWNSGKQLHFFFFCTKDMGYVSIFFRKSSSITCKNIGSLVTTKAHKFCNTWDMFAHGHNPDMDLPSSMIESHWCFTHQLDRSLHLPPRCAQQSTAEHHSSVPAQFEDYLRSIPLVANPRRRGAREAPDVG
jgi:hypothetical protein